MVNKGKKHVNFTINAVFERNNPLYKYQNK